MLLTGLDGGFVDYDHAERERLARRKCLHSHHDHLPLKLLVLSCRPQPTSSSAGWFSRSGPVCADPAEVERGRDNVMSWFPDDFEACRLVDADRPGIEPPGHELAPGVHVERSGVFSLSRRALLGSAAVLLAGTGVLRGQDPQKKSVEPPSVPPDSGFGPITLEQFVARAEPLADALVADEEANEDAYLLHLASLLCRLDPAPGSERQSEMPVRMSRIHKGPHFAVMQIKMAEGAALPFHDHHEYNGVILGLEGTVHARNFERIEGELRPADDEPFEIRETVRSTLTPGRISTLSRRRDNIHDLRGGEGGGRILDIFTFFEGSEGSRYLEVEDVPVDSERHIYRATWRQRRPRRD